MIEAYNEISSIWKTFPFQLKGTPIYQQCQHLQEEFERQRMFFDDYNIKIVIIGNISTGKSTLINTMIERNLFGTLAGHGTASFFYCCKTNKSYEYFTINDFQEIKAVDVLQNASELNHKLDGFIDENCIIKVYIDDNNNEIFKYKTIIIDCPGLEKDEKYDLLIRQHCSNANLFLFLFDIEAQATLKQKKYIKEILNNFKNPSCFFIYNKCDKFPYDIAVLNKIKSQFYEGFDSQYVTDLKVSGEPLYFISAQTELNKIMSSQNSQSNNSFYSNEFIRFKSNIMNFRIACHSRLQTNLNNLLEKLENYTKFIDDLLVTIKIDNDIIYQYNPLDKRLNEINMHCSYIKERLTITNKDSIERIKEKDFYQFIIDEIDKYEECCDRNDATKFINKLGNEIDKKIKAFIQNHIDKFWYSQIKHLLENEILKDKFKHCNYQIGVFLKIVPVNMNINIFWWHESGDKTLKVKQKFREFIKSQSKEITKSIIIFYEKQLDTFSTYILSTIENIQADEFYINTNATKVPINKSDLINHLENYRMEVLKYVKKYQIHLAN